MNIPTDCKVNVPKLQNVGVSSYSKGHEVLSFNILGKNKYVLKFVHFVNMVLENVLKMYKKNLNNFFFIFILKKIVKLKVLLTKR